MNKQKGYQTISIILCISILLSVFPHSVLASALNQKNPALNNGNMSIVAENWPETMLTNLGLSLTESGLESIPNEFTQASLDLIDVNQLLSDTELKSDEFKNPLTISRVQTAYTTDSVINSTVIRV